jgi:hypothetical protein
MLQDSQKYYKNNNLFSNYYLDNYLKKSPEWEKTDHIVAFEQIQSLCNDESKLLQNYNEKQLENHFFNKIFNILGFVYEVTPSTEARNYPDYAFFIDRQNLEDAHIQKRKSYSLFFTNAIAIGEVKQWKVDLDKISKNEYSISENPSLQIRTYLDDTQQKWGILTNGRYWRIYCKEKRREDYFEVDLPFLILSNDIEAFRFFYYFFRKDAFISSQEGLAFLDRVLKESFEYATEIGDSLKENVYRAMKRIAEGFIERSSNNLDRNDPTTLLLVQNNSMLLLYRFLFLLYAEGKGLLDLNNPQYLKNFSYHRLKHNISEIQDGPIDRKYTSIKCSLLTELKDLFKLVNQGSESFGIQKEEFYIPAYNGGLFDPDKHPYLERWEIGDQYLAEAIDFLSRSELKDGHRDFVDYSTLEIRHLGSIYEGLLEYKLKIADSDLVVSDDGWVPLYKYNAMRMQKKTFADFNEFNRVAVGHLYLATDKDERKSTGSYYTPDYIVNYIIADSIGPIVDKKWQNAYENNVSYIEATLSINVLDPAMGSGHFLVGAVDFLSKKLLEAVQKDYELNIIKDTGSFTNEWARREVVSHCIYGVDLNELAVELAKVGLWLTTISKDKPLSFLDHRLKQGNSLVGAWLSELNYYPELEKDKYKISHNQTVLKISPLFIHHLLSKINEIDKISEDTLEGVKRKEKIFEEFKHLPEYEKTKAVANVYTSIYFGNQIDQILDNSKKYYQSLFRESQYNDEKSWERKTKWKWFTRANEIAKKYQFFHWELEFPEIFFDAGKIRENPGWDTIIGNPPWEKISARAPEKHFLDIKFQSIREGEINFYYLFLYRCHDLAINEGRIGQIVPNTWMINKFCNLLREFILNNYRITNVHYLCKNVFKDAPDTIPVILNFINSKKNLDEKILDNDISVRVVNDDLLDTPTFLTTSAWEDSVKQKTWYERELHQMSVFDTNKNSLFCGSLESNSILLNDIGHASDGIYKSTVEKFRKKTQGLPTDRPVIESANQVQRYEINWDGSFIPEELWSKHEELHTGEKIILHAARKPKLYRRLVAALTEDLIFFSNRFIIIKLVNSDYSAPYVFSLINSKILNRYYRIRFPITDIDGYMLHQLPIRKIKFTTSNQIRASHIDEAIELYIEFSENFDDKKVLNFIDLRLSAQPEESDVVHDFLVFLSNQMVEMNKQKNAEINTFLNFIENEIGCPIDNLSNKTHIQEYYTIEFTKFIEIIFKNKNKLKSGYSPKSRANHDILKDWFDSSIAKLNPLCQKIDITDTLIDQIVYKLYNLSEEEIKILEDQM